MSLLTPALVAVGGLMLMHGIYSSYEHSLLAPTATLSTSSTTKSTASHPSLPLDIIIETLLSTLILTFAIVYSAPALRPIRWREWAGKIEREGWDPHAESNIGKVVEGASGLGDGSRKGKGGVGNPYRGLEERRAFWDVRAAQKSFADYIRQGSETQKHSA